MELELIRKYFDEGTNGEIHYQDRLMTYTLNFPGRTTRYGFRASLKEDMN